MFAAAGQVVALLALVLRAPHGSALLAAVHTLQAGAALQLLADVRG